MKKRVKKRTRKLNRYNMRPVIKISGEQIDFWGFILAVLGLVIDTLILVAIFAVS